MASARAPRSKPSRPAGEVRASRSPRGRGSLVCVAQIGAPHGVRGEVRLRSFTEDPMALTRYGALEAEDGSRALELETLRPAKNALVARFAGVTDRETAAELRNIKLYVPRARLPEPEHETYYHGDLIGLMAVDPHGAVLGTVCAVQNFGAGDLIEIAPSAGGHNVLLPFTKAFVPAVDIPGGRIVVEMLALEPSPSRTRVFPSSAIDDGSKSETSDTDVGEGGERTKSTSRVRGRHPEKPLTRSEPSARTTLSHKGRG
jgi:16S rRNA processing protein RimM